MIFKIILFISIFILSRMLVIKILSIKLNKSM